MLADGTGPDGVELWSVRTDLRISASKAKFDARADGAVRLAVHRPKSRKIREKNISDPKRDFFLFAPIFFFCNFCGRRKFFGDFPSPEV